MRWLSECSAEALGEALRVVAPELSGGPVTVPVPDPAVKGDPLWWSSSTVAGERFIVKFAWSRPAALRLAHEIGVLTALARECSASTPKHHLTNPAAQREVGSQLSCRAGWPCPSRSTLQR
jgi:hypothetical protein